MDEKQIVVDIEFSHNGEYSTAIFPNGWKMEIRTRLTWGVMKGVLDVLQMGDKSGAAPILNFFNSHIKGGARKVPIKHTHLAFQAITGLLNNLVNSGMALDIADSLDYRENDDTVQVLVDGKPKITLRNIHWGIIEDVEEIENLMGSNDEDVPFDHFVETMLTFLDEYTVEDVSDLKLVDTGIVIQGLTGYIGHTFDDAKKN